MKIHSKQLIGALSIVSLLAPLATFAAPNRINGAGSFCTNLDTMSAKIMTGIDTRTATFAEKKSERIAHLADKRVLRDEKRNEHRDTVDGKHDTRYDALMAKADTDAKKAAVNTFKADVEAATATRRAAIDTAVKTFRAGVDSLIASKQSGFDTATTTFQQAVASAIQKAKDSCAGGTAPATVRETLKADIQSAREAFKNTRTTNDIQTELQALTTVRKNAVAAAVATFKTDMDSAKDALKTAFGE